MPRPSPHGVQGLIRRVDADGTVRWSFLLRYRVAGQHRRYHETMPVGTSATAAKARAKALLAAAVGGADLAAGRDTRTLAKALEDYVKWRRDNGRTEIEQAETTARGFVAILGDVALASLSPLGIERYKARRREQGAAPATVNRGLALFRHFAKLAAAWGWIPRDLSLALREVKLLREPPGRTRYLRDDEAERLRVAVEGRPWLQRLVEAALLTGARQGELLSLRKADVDLAAGEIVLRKTKNGKVRRVPIAEALAPILRAAMRASACEHALTGPEGQLLTRHALQHAWGAVREAAGLEDLHWHDLRHSAATTLRQRGVGLDVLQQILGHSSITMTMRYAHVAADAMRAALRDLPALGAAETLTTNDVAAPSLAIVK
jgi:integrase